MKSRAINKKIKLSHTRSVAFAAASGIFSAGGSKLSETCLSLLNEGRYKDLISMSVDPSTYTDGELFAVDYLACELMSKFPDFPVDIDRKQVAISKFLEAEGVCRETNDRLKKSYGVASTTTSSASIFYAAQRKIARLLGPFNWDEAARHFAWGPGASTQVRSREADAYFKYGVTKPHVTSSCAMLAACAIAQSPAWYKHVAGLSGNSSFAMPSPALIARDHLDVVEGNRVVTVPKNAKTDRVIAIEPHMNMYIQKGIGALIRRRLLKAGIDLNDQTRNQTLAREGSISGLLATIDLSAASDSIAMELVSLLLPEDWVLAIKLTRSPVGVLPDGSKVSYQKVSSMGNGFTFELESLIFWALCSACVQSFVGESERCVGVYGDDLIIPRYAYPLVRDQLQTAGFQLNAKKSFADGPFRESCGKHYFLGRDVSPFYIREDVNTVARFTWLANTIRRYSSQGMSYGLCSRYKQVYDLVVGQLPRRLRQPTISDGFGDGSLFGDLDEVRPSRHKSWDGWVCETFIADPSRKRVTGGALLLKALSPHVTWEAWWQRKLPPSVLQAALDGFDKGRSDTIPVERPWLKSIKLFIPQWQDRGPWL